MLIIDWELLSIATGFYLSLFAIKWALGRRSEALTELENIANIVAGILILQFILSASEQVMQLIGTKPPVELQATALAERIREILKPLYDATTALARLPLPPSAPAQLFLLLFQKQIEELLSTPLPAYQAANATLDTAFIQQSLRAASHNLQLVSQAAYQAVIDVKALQAAAAMTPLASQYASIIGSMTGWSTTLLLIESAFFLWLSLAATAFSVIAPWLGTIGMLVFPLPKLRRLGATLLATYIATSIALIYCGGIAGSVDVTAPPPQPSGNILEKLTPVVNAANALAEALLDLMAKCTAALALAALAGWGLAGAFEGAYVSLAHP